MRRLGLVLAFGLAATLCFAPGASAAVGATKKPVPATAQLTFAGSAGLAGLATAPQVTCSFPNVDGSVMLFVLAQPSDPTAAFNIKVNPGSIAVTVSSGSGTAFRSRSFEGTGVKGFNGAKGAKIDSTLTETTANTPGSNPGTLGAISSVKGSIACGSQTTGTSTVAFSGTTAEGAVNGGAHPFRVECDTSASNGNYVTLVGVLKVGSVKALFFVTLMPDSVFMFEGFPGPPPAQHQYVVKAPGVSTLSATGAHVAGDAVDVSSTGGAAHTLHVTGKVTCGTTVNR